ncbi:uncharacterized protein ACUXST_001838 [Sphingomonas sp. F9_3S_D5_B_2]|jgi:ankyrin repeat protein
MKFMKLALAGLCFAASTTASVAQDNGTKGSDFVSAVRSRDTGKAMQLYQSVGRRIVDAKGAKGDTALIAAISNNDEAFTAFLINGGADPNLAGQDGDTPLIAAAKSGYAEAVEWLISAGAKVDTANRRGETPLIIAVQLREPRIAKVLLNQGANPDRTDSVAGFSARDYAKRDNRSREILQMIEQKKPKAGA